MLTCYTCVYVGVGCRHPAFMGILLIAAECWEVKHEQFCWITTGQKVSVFNSRAVKKREMEFLSCRLPVRGHFHPITKLTFTAWVWTFLLHFHEDWSHLHYNNNKNKTFCPKHSSLWQIFNQFSLNLVFPKNGSQQCEWFWSVGIVATLACWNI